LPAFIIFTFNPAAMRFTVSRPALLSIVLQIANALELLEHRNNPLVFGYDLCRRDAIPFGAQLDNFLVSLPCDLAVKSFSISPSPKLVNIERVILYNQYHGRRTTSGSDGGR
jgi:hypothetical protein